jgi:hypothetical protein
MVRSIRRNDAESARKEGPDCRRGTLARCRRQQSSGEFARQKLIRPDTIGLHHQNKDLLLKK